MILGHQPTVDGRNPAPVRMVNIPLSIGFYTSQVVQDFFHQQYEEASSRETGDEIIVWHMTIIHKPEFFRAFWGEMGGFPY